MNVEENIELHRGYLTYRKVLNYETWNKCKSEENLTVHINSPRAGSSRLGIKHLLSHKCFALSMEDCMNTRLYYVQQRVKNLENKHEIIYRKILIID
jgi:hypothetical protein